MITALTDKDDVTLVQLFRDGNSEAFGVIIEKYSPKLSKQLFPLLTDPMLVEDVMQDTFMKAMKAIKKGSYHEEGNLGAWLARVANNLAMDYFRNTKNRRVTSVSPDDIYTEGHFLSGIESEEPNPEQLFINNQLGYNIEELLNELPEEQKEVITLRFFQDFSFKEIADFTGESINTCLGRMRYGLMNLRRNIGHIQKYGNAESKKS